MIKWFRSLFRKLKPVEAPAPINIPPQEPTSNSTPALPDWPYLWQTLSYDQDRLAEIEKYAGIMYKNKARYKAVELVTGVPWKLIASLHYREASLNFNTCLHNGDPLPGPTRHVPSGRGPFSSWEAGAIDALRYDGLDRFRFVDEVSSLIMAEKFNGMGYRKRGIYSPYVWAGSNHSNETGKYVADGSYSATAKERQLGVAVLLKKLAELEGA